MNLVRQVLAFFYGIVFVVLLLAIGLYLYSTNAALQRLDAAMQRLAEVDTILHERINFAEDQVQRLKNSRPCPPARCPLPAPKCPTKGREPAPYTAPIPDLARPSVPA